MPDPSLPPAFHSLVAESAAMRTLLHRAAEVARQPWPVLITGETGTGKTELARAIHEASEREGRFVALNCAALTATLVESELFGHTRGAFTGATNDAPGLFEAANGGTLLLDEIGDLAEDAQAKVLRAIETGLVRRIGADSETQVDVRIIGATHRSLEEGMAAGQFRTDLYYRINTVILDLPPLRDRTDDIASLAARFLAESAGAGASFDGSALRALRAHTWPGNLRELQAVVRQATLSADGGRIVGARHVPLGAGAGEPPAAPSAGPGKLARLLLDAMAVGANKRERWARFLLAVRATQDTDQLHRKTVLGLLRELRGQGPTENALDIEWKRAVRARLLTAGLIQNVSRKLLIDTTACQAALPADAHGGAAAPVTGGPAEGASGPDTVSVAPTAPGLSTVGSTLPMHPVPIIGRDADVAAVLALLDGPGHLVTLTGHGGLGKTTLALVLGQRLRDTSRFEVWFVDLREARTGEDVSTAVARVLDVAGGDVPAVDRVRDDLAQRSAPTLLILDNFEQVADASQSTIGAWRDAAPALSVLVTSRHTLGMRGEVRYELAPLGVPEEHATADEVEASGAGALLLARAQQVMPVFRITAGNADAVGKICRQLNGIPLAIELAAARMRVLSPGQLVSRLGGKLQLLRNPHADVPDNQRTLAATLDWSWDLLEPAEREAFARMSVFRGGFTLEAAETVIPPLPDDADVLEALGGLVDKSLVRFTRVEGEDAARYQVFVVVREYGEKRLAELLDDDGRRELHIRHAGCYAELATRLSPAIRRGSAAAAEADLELGAEFDNVTGALEWTSANGEPLLAGALADGAAPMLVLAGLGSTAYRLVVDALDALPPDADAMRARLVHARLRVASISGTRSGWETRDADVAAALDMLRKRAAAESPPGESHLQLADMLYDRVQDVLQFGQSDEAMKLTDEAETICRRADLQLELAEVFFLRALVLAGQDRPAEAVATIQQALPAVRLDGSSRLLARMLYTLGRLQILAGQIGEGIDRLAESVDVGRATGRAEMEAQYALSYIDEVLTLGRIDLARGMIDRHATMLERFARRTLIGAVQMRRIELHLAHAEGDVERAVEIAEGIWRQTRGTDHYWSTDRLLIDAARFRMDAGDAAGALGLIEQIDETAGNAGRIYWLGTRAEILDRLGRHEEARRDAEATQSIPGQFPTRGGLFIRNLTAARNAIARILGQPEVM